MACCRPMKRWAVAAAIAILLPAVSLGAGGFTFPLPIGAKNPSGLRLSIDGYGIEANGYRPVVIQLSTRGGTPLPADRQGRGVLEFSRNGPGTSGQASPSVDVPDGS